MQRMHQSYKYMKAQQKKLVGVHPTCLLMKTQGILRNPTIGIYKPSSIMKDSHQYMKVTTQETLYHEDYGATLKHKCGKKYSNIVPSLFFSHFFSFFGAFSFLWPFSLFFFNFTSLGTMLQKMMIITLLFIYNSMIQLDTRIKMILYECLRRCNGMCNDA